MKQRISKNLIENRYYELMADSSMDKIEVTFRLGLMLLNYYNLIDTADIIECIKEYGIRELKKL